MQSDEARSSWAAFFAWRSSGSGFQTQNIRDRPSMANGHAGPWIGADAGLDRYADLDVRALRRSVCILGNDSTWPPTSSGASPIPYFQIIHPKTPADGSNAASMPRQKAPIVASSRLETLGRKRPKEKAAKPRLGSGNPVGECSAHNRSAMPESRARARCVLVEGFRFFEQGSSRLDALRALRGSGSDRSPAVRDIRAARRRLMGKAATQHFCMLFGV